MKVFFRVSVFLILSGCMVGPNYQAPKPPMPDKFVETQNKTSSDDDLCQWWKQLNDPMLDSLLEEAIKANFDFLIAIEKITQARAQYSIQSAQLFPEIDINAIATRTRNSQNFFRSTASSANGGIPPYQNFFQVGFDAIWELDFFGKFRRAKRAAYNQWEASKDNADFVLITVLSEVARNYVIIRSLQQQIELTLRKIRADHEELELTLALFDSGLDSEIEVDTLLATLENDRSTLPGLQTSYKQTIYALAVLIGRQPETLVSEFKEPKPIPIGMDKVPIGLPSDLLRRRPDIKQAERQLAAATEQIGVAVADLFPHISLTGTTFSGTAEAGSGYGYQSNSLNTLLKAASRFWSVGPAIRWDFIDFGKTRGNIAVQTSLQKQALLTYEQTVINSLQDVEGALIAYFQEQRRRVFLKNQVDANKKTLELTKDLYEAGLASELQVLITQKTVIESELSLTGSDQALTSDLIALYKALGGNWQCCYTP